MAELSIGANMAWKIAAHEAASARFQFIEAERYIAQKGYNPQYGARELRRTVEMLIQMPLSNLILSGKMKEYKEWQVVCRDEGIEIVPC